MSGCQRSDINFDMTAGWTEQDDRDSKDCQQQPVGAGSRIVPPRLTPMSLMQAMALPHPSALEH